MNSEREIVKKLHESRRLKESKSGVSEYLMVSDDPDDFSSLVGKNKLGPGYPGYPFKKFPQNTSDKYYFYMAQCPDDVAGIDEDGVAIWGYEKDDDDNPAPLSVLKDLAKDLKK